MASFLNISSPSPLIFSTSIPLSSHPHAPNQLKICCWDRRFLLFQVKCSTEPAGDAESEPEPKTKTVPYLFSSDTRSISSYNWCAGLGGLGFVKTGYLTFLKFTNSEAFCPIGGGTCSDILNSDYAVVFGIPLPLFGMVAYGLVASLALKLAVKELPFGIDESHGRLILLGTTTSMATASAYFLYILSTQFMGVSSCSYCLLSALLSFSLFFTTLKILGWEEVRKEVGLQLCVAGLVFAALSSSYNNSIPAMTSLAEGELPYFTTEITKQSTPFALSLAKHLRSVGAKMYGAFWCSHCIEQKQMFGREAAKLLDYIECFPNGYRKGTKIAKACADVGIEGFPMWIINGQVLSGDQELSELAKVSGFVSEGLTEPS